MWLVVCNTKLQFSKLVCSTIHFNILVINIFVILHMILSIFPVFTWRFFCFLSSKISCLCYALYKCFWNSCAKPTPEFYADVFIYICVSKLLLPGSCKFAIKLKIIFLCSIKAVHNLSPMAWFTYTTINNYIKGMGQYGQ